MGPNVQSSIKTITTKGIQYFRAYNKTFYALACCFRCTSSFPVQLCTVHSKNQLLKVILL